MLSVSRNTIRPTGSWIAVRGPAAHGYGDALRGPCGFLFYDGFESGDVALWNGDAASGEVGF